MKDYIRQRVLDVGALFLTQDNPTIREIAKKVGASKSTVSNDVNLRLQKVNQIWFYKVRAILEYNKQDRVYRGGEATRRKYKGE